MTSDFFETVTRRRSAALLSEFGLGHVREYAPFGLILRPCISSFVQSLSTFASNVREWHFVQHSLFRNSPKTGVLWWFIIVVIFAVESVMGLAKWRYCTNDDIQSVEGNGVRTSSEVRRILAPTSEGR